MATVIDDPATATATPQAATTPPEQLPTPRRFTVAEYYRMAEAGVLRPEERIELIEGRILKMSPKGVEHAACNDNAAECFRKHLGERVIVRNRNPIHLTDDTEPEPDLVLAAPHEKRYFDHHPLPSEVLLVLEVAGSSLNFDRRDKGLTYAKAGIIQYLVLNVRNGEIEDYREPAAEGYRSKQTYTAGQSFNLVAFPDVSVGISELLPLS